MWSPGMSATPVTVTVGAGPWYVATVDWLTVVPSSPNPPWIRATTLSGFTKTSAVRHSLQMRENHVQNRRSAGVRRTRDRRGRSKTRSW